MSELSLLEAAKEAVRTAEKYMRISNHMVPQGGPDMHEKMLAELDLARAAIAKAEAAEQTAWFLRNKYRLFNNCSDVEPDWSQYCGLEMRFIVTSDGVFDVATIYAVRASGGLQSLDPITDVKECADIHYTLRELMERSGLPLWEGEK